MSDTVTMTETELGVRLRADAQGTPKAVLRAMFSAAQRGKAWIVGKTPVDRGILRNAWKVIKLSIFQEVHLVNDQPYAGIVERGSRPFKISGAGIWALKGWVMRRMKAGDIYPSGAGHRVTWARGWKKLLNKAKGQSQITKKRKIRISRSQMEKEAESIAYAIAKTFEKIGMKGKRFILQNLPILASLMDEEMKRSLSTFFNRPLRKNNG